MEAISLKEEKEIVDTMGCLGIVRVFADNVFDGKAARQLITDLFSFLHTITLTYVFLDSLSDFQGAHLTIW